MKLCLTYYYTSKSFLNKKVTVLPPGEWDPSIRLDPRLYHNHHHHASGARSRRIAFEPKLEPSMENSDKWSEGNNDGGSGSENSHSLSTTNKLFQGVQGDFSVWRHRQRDYKDGFNFKCVGTGLFMYFLLLAVISTIGESERMSSGGLIVSRTLFIFFCKWLFNSNLKVPTQGMNPVSSNIKRLTLT